MSDQDWTPVILKRSKPKTSIVSKNTNHEGLRLRKVEDSETFVKPKMFSHESLKTIVAYRVEHKMSQSDLDMMCGFPRNTVQQLESKKLSPSTKQLQVLNKILKTGLSLSN